MVKQMVKLVVSDFDGTLLPYGEERLSDKVVARINEILNMGIVFAVSSGRTYSELLKYLSDYRDKIYYSCCDGAVTVKNGKVIYSRKIELGDMELFFKNKSDGFSFVLHGADLNYGVGTLPPDADRFCAKKISGIYEIKEKIYKITSYGESINLPEYCALRKHWDGGDNKTTQFVNRYCNKGTALSDLQTRLMVTKYDTACLGDRGNDVCMMKGSRLSYCIGDRCRELMQICNFGFDNAEDAIEHLLETVKI